eukprot:SAG31_NODE_1394_length_8528_cov_24.396251_2_plen_85_part_00
MKLFARLPDRGGGGGGGGRGERKGGGVLLRYTTHHWGFRRGRGGGRGKGRQEEKRVSYKCVHNNRAGRASRAGWYLRATFRVFR